MLVSVDCYLLFEVEEKCNLCNLSRQGLNGCSEERCMLHLLTYVDKCETNLFLAVKIKDVTSVSYALRSERIIHNKFSSTSKSV